jgi:hypothetical protein
VADRPAAARTPLGRRFVATAAALLGRRSGQAPAAPAFELPAAIGASDIELVRLSRQPFGATMEEIRLTASRALTTGMLRPR